MTLPPRLDLYWQTGAMNIDERNAGDVTILDVRGRLTMNEGHGLLAGIMESLLARGCVRVVLNLRDLKYLDSACLGEIINAHIRLSRKGGRLKLLDMPEHLHELLRIAGLDGVFEAFSSEAEALRSFQA